MIIHREVPQGGQAWLNLRCGVPTSSEFDRIITPGGKPSKSAIPFMNALLAERIMGHPRKNVVTMYMARGSALEADAVSYFEFQRDCVVERVGFISNDCGTIGTSPDGLVGEDGLIEIKCGSDETHVGWLLSNEGQSVDKDYKVQVMGQLWLTERRYCDILAYHPDMPWAIFRVERDEDYIALLAKEVTEFSEKLEAEAAKLVERGLIKPKLSLPEELPTRSGVSQFIGDEEMAWALSRSYPTEEKE